MVLEVSLAHVAARYGTKEIGMTAKPWKFELTVTVRAEDCATAAKIISRKLNSLPSQMIADDPLEGYEFIGSTATASMWRDRNDHPAPKDGKPFFAVDSHIDEPSEFSTAIRWHSEAQKFVDAKLKEFLFTHWMPIPKL